MQSVLEARMRIPCAQTSQLPQCPPVAMNARFCNDAHSWNSSVLGTSAFFSGPRMRIAYREIDAEVSGTRLHVVCMARERRIKMVSQQIKREISEMLLYDKVLQAAILPESALGADMYLTAVATISEVEMSKDLSVAKVYISIYGDERGQETALEGLKNKSGYVRKGLAQRMNLKFTPEIRFIKDEALERGSRVISILEKLKQERERKEQGGSVNISEDEGREDGEMEEEEEEEEIPRSKSRLSADADDSDWVEEDENITFIK
ncbi:hypothetical protein Mapa_008781 [Marchantia paleacea]|nr:hypothetical protein Mapa_008781 [Marchantia paleacea]